MSAVQPALPLMQTEKQNRARGNPAAKHHAHVGRVVLSIGKEVGILPLHPGETIPRHHH